MKMPNMKSYHWCFTQGLFSLNKIFVFLKLKIHWKILQCSFDFIKSRVFMHLWATYFLGSHRRMSRTFSTFLRSFTLGGGGGGDLPHLALANTCIYIYIYIFSCYATESLDFGHCPIFELTTRSLRMVNNHYHAHTPDLTRCYRAYEMQICHFMPC